MKSTIRLSILLITIILSLLNALGAQAATVAIWELPSKGMTFKVAYKDADNIRISIEEDLYLLVKDSGLFMVSNSSVLDINALRKKIQDWSLVRYMAEKVEARSKRVPSPENIKATGKHETVAGIEGEIFRATISNPETGLEEEREIVLTSDKKLLKLKKAMNEIADKNMETFHNKGFRAMRNSMRNSFPSEMSILRYGSKFQVASLTEQSIDQKHFELPENLPIKSLPGILDISMFARLAAPFTYD